MMDAHDHKNLTGQLRWLMFFRVVMTTFLLGTTIVVQWRVVGGIQDTALTALYSLIGFTYFLTFIYALFLPRVTTPAVQAYLQITGDILITTVVIYLTGGVESIFSFMYILTIINAGILLKMRGGMITASLAVIFYGALLDLHYYHYIEPYLTRFTSTILFRPADVLNKLLVNSGAFYLVAFLTGYLSGQAEESRLKLEAKESILKRLEGLNESIIESIDSGLMTLGPSGEILSLNPAGERITGVPFVKLKGRPYTQIFPDLVIPDVSAFVGESDYPLSLAFKRNDGESLFLELTVQGLRDEYGDTWGRLLVIQDKSRIRQMEDEVQRIEKLAMVGELAAGIAHEIRNPLASLSGSFQMLEEDLEGGPDQKRLLNIIRRELDHLSHIVNDFLLFARPRSPAHARTDLSRIVDDTLRMFGHQVGLNDRIHVKKDIQPAIWVRFDPNQLEQVMWNLLQNATEAMPTGGDLNVAVHREPATPSEALITVSDTGQGITPDCLNKIFDPFFTTKERGSGLGLSIVFRILDSGGGRIRVTSNPGQGTTFYVTLPVVDEEKQPGQARRLGRR